MSKKVVKTRNNVLLDKWSIAHLFFGILLGWLFSPLVAIVMLVIWEPIEIFILSPLLARVNVTFGYETLKNSLIDIVVDISGVLIGSLLIQAMFPSPF